jgi:hypothetical protein
MQLFTWRSNALKRFQPGHILVLAEDVDAARRIALEQFEHWLKSEAGEWHLLVDGVPVDEFAEDDLERMRSELLRDLEQDPQSGSAVFIRGSE